MASVERDLVYDVGMHDGRDTAYYLWRGYRVVAIDANPDLVAAGRARFATEVADGRLVLLNVGIGEDDTEGTFWLGDRATEWSSFDPSFPAREGARSRGIRVQVRRFGPILREYGLPHYCKIDIEGSDHLCLADLEAASRPRYISVEALPRQPLLERLADLGYNRFKVVDQARFCPASRTFLTVRRWTPRRLHQRLDRVNTVVRGRSADRGWSFTVGSSGPLPERTPGHWLSYGKARAMLDHLDEQRERGRLGIFDWYDLHATTIDA
jgi:FkbM family methyltransferase